MSSHVERATPLLDEHRRLGARLTEFAGWEMPLQYTGIVAEHNAVRSSCGVFDVSHLGKLRLGGARSGEALQDALTADVLALEPGQARYSLVLTDEGTTVDDIFVYRRGDADWLVVPNAANVGPVGDMIRRSGGEVVDEWDRYAILAVQGPDAYDVFERVFESSAVSELKLHRFRELDVFGHQGLVARTGYTGERGVELYAPAPSAPEAWRRLLDAGATPVGLGARDTLRLEMGYALYGHELSLEINPLEAGLSWAIAWDSGFRGKEALEKVRTAGADRKLVGVRLTERGVPRQGYRVLVGDDPVGVLTSGNFSPTLNTGIGLALVDRARAPEIGQSVAVEARGRRLTGDIVKPPFISRK